MSSHLLHQFFISFLSAAEYQACSLGSSQRGSPLGGVCNSKNLGSVASIAFLWHAYDIQEPTPRQSPLVSKPRHLSSRIAVSLGIVVMHGR